MSERAFQKLIKELNGLGWRFSGEKSLASTVSYYSNGHYYCYKPDEDEEDDDWDWGGDEEFGFRGEQSTFSCAVPNIGDFVLPKKAEQRPFEILLEICKLKHASQGFIECVTLDKKEWLYCNRALAETGFVKVASVPTRHEGKYNNFIWNWVR